MTALARASPCRSSAGYMRIATSRSRTSPRRRGRSAFRDLKLVHYAGAGHIGGDLSAIDIRGDAVQEVLDRPRAVDDPGQDRFILSKGHRWSLVRHAGRLWVPAEEWRRRPS